VLTQTATASGELAEQQAKSAAPAKFQQSGEAAGIKFNLTVEPNQADTVNNYTVNVTNPDGSPSTTVSLARLRFTYQDSPNGVAPSQLDLDRQGDGIYRGAGVYFTTQGNWRIDMTIRRTDADDVAHAFILPVGPKAASTATGGGSIFALPFKVFNWNEVLGAALALGGGLVLVYRRQIGFGNVAYRATVTGATGIVLAGAVLAFGVHQHTATKDPTIGNPVKSTPESIAAGKMLFQSNCVQCHGIDGRGDGEEAAKLSPAPTDFRLHMPLHTDPQFYGFIHDGYQGSAMPAFGSAFSQDDIWNLVNYLRSAFTAPPSQ
jgi:mono/diheme cytochrome c family protein